MVWTTSLLQRVIIPLIFRSLFSTSIFAQMAPGNIDDFNGSYSLKQYPQILSKASSTSSTGLGAMVLSEWQ